MFPTITCSSINVPTFSQALCEDLLLDSTAGGHKKILLVKAAKAVAYLLLACVRLLAVIC